MTDDVPSLESVLCARESRAARQRALIGAYACPVVSVTCVAPGPTKRSPTIERVFGLAATSVAIELARRGWPVLERVELHSTTGPELQLAVGAPATELKDAMVGLEESVAWGRLWDLDVVGEDGPLSRPMVGRPPRRCLLCDEAAAGCARSGRHDPRTIAAAVERIVADRAGWPLVQCPAGGAARAIGALAAEALRVEARLAPKPGLVDVLDNGAHEDMTLQHFLASAEALEPWFARMAALGARPRWHVAALRELGMSAEQAMHSATGGLNTHRGAVFILGWLCAVAGGGLSSAEGDRPSASGEVDRGGGAPLWSVRLRRLTSPQLREWQAAGATAKTHGRQAFDTYGLTGARGEAASGLHSVVRHGLPRYRRALGQGWAPDDALLAALVSLLAVVDDTNLVSRGGIDGLRSVQEWARSIERQGLAATDLRDALASANDRFSERGWSPGGVADLLAATWFVEQLQQGS